MNCWPGQLIPVAHLLLEYFVHNLFFIHALRGEETDIYWCGSDEFLNMSKPERDARLRTTEGDPALLNQRAKQAFAEIALQRFLGVTSRSKDGWLQIYINGSSVAVELVHGPDVPLAYASPEQFKAGIVVVAYPEGAPTKVHLLGWTTKEVFTREHKRVERDGAMACVLALGELFVMEALKEMADRGSMFLQ